MELPTGVLAYKVLKNANILNEKQQLIRATLTSLTYENMKKQLKAINDSSINSASSNIKEEQVFLTQKKRVMLVVNVIQRILNIIMDAIRKRDIKEELKIVENPLINGEERPTPRIIWVIFLVVLHTSQFTIGQNNFQIKVQSNTK